jgi:hypothetical protein
MVKSLPAKVCDEGHDANDDQAVVSSIVALGEFSLAELMPPNAFALAL